MTVFWFGLGWLTACVIGLVSQVWFNRNKSRSTRERLEALTNEGLESALASSPQGHQPRPEAAGSEAIAERLLQLRQTHSLDICFCREGKRCPWQAVLEALAVPATPTTQTDSQPADRTSQTSERKTATRPDRQPLKEGVPYQVHPDGSIRERQTESGTSAGFSGTGILGHCRRCGRLCSDPNNHTGCHQDLE